MKQIRALAPHAKKLTLSDTRESIGEKSAARVPVFFNFFKIIQTLQQSAAGFTPAFLFMCETE